MASNSTQPTPNCSSPPPKRALSQVDRIFLERTHEDKILAAMFRQADEAEAWAEERRREKRMALWKTKSCGDDTPKTARKTDEEHRRRRRKRDSEEHTPPSSPTFTPRVPVETTDLPKSPSEEEEEMPLVNRSVLRRGPLIKINIAQNIFERFEEERNTDKE